MVSWPHSPYSQSEAHVIIIHCEEIERHLATPTAAWWIESILEPRVKHLLKEEGLIETVPSGRWRATEGLWSDVIGRAGDDETIGGAATGQELIVEAREEQSQASGLAKTGSLART